MFKLISYVFFAIIIYFIGNLAYERYAYISDRRDWLEQGNAVECTAQDHARLLEHVKTGVFAPFSQRLAASGLTENLSDIQFHIAPFASQTLTGDGFNSRICTTENFPWKQGKGGPHGGNCSMPAFMHCTANVEVRVAGDIVKLAGLAARYLPRRQHAGAETITIAGQDYALFSIHAELNKIVPRYAASRLYQQQLHEGVATPEFRYNISTLSSIIDNWLAFHENREEVIKQFTVANDIGGAITGGGYAGSINKLRNEQIQLPSPPTSP